VDFKCLYWRPPNFSPTEFRVFTYRPMVFSRYWRSQVPCWRPLREEVTPSTRFADEWELGYRRGGTSSELSLGARWNRAPEARPFENEDGGPGETEVR
jgi:hypothetical protein